MTMKISKSTGHPPPPVIAPETQQVAPAEKPGVNAAKDSIGANALPTWKKVVGSGAILSMYGGATAQLANARPDVVGALWLTGFVTILVGAVYCTITGK